jgi:hypothetical protein
VENEIKELESMKAYTCMGVEESHNMDHGKENGKVKEYVRRLRFILNADLRAENARNWNTGNNSIKTQLPNF